MALALNNQKRVDMPLNKETKPKTVIEKEWNKMSKKFILKAYKSYRRRIDTIIEKKSGHVE